MSLESVEKKADAVVQMSHGHDEAAKQAALAGFMHEFLQTSTSQGTWSFANRNAWQYAELNTVLHSSKVSQALHDTVSDKNATFIGLTGKKDGLVIAHNLGKDGKANENSTFEILMEDGRIVKADKHVVDGNVCFDAKSETPVVVDNPKPPAVTESASTLIKGQVTTDDGGRVKNVTAGNLKIDVNYSDPTTVSTIDINTPSGHLYHLQNSGKVTPEGKAIFLSQYDQGSYVGGMTYEVSINQKKGDPNFGKVTLSELQRDKDQDERRTISFNLDGTVDWTSRDGSRRLLTVEAANGGWWGQWGHDQSISVVASPDAAELKLTAQPGFKYTGSDGKTYKLDQSDPNKLVLNQMDGPNGTIPVMSSVLYRNGVYAVVDPRDPSYEVGGIKRFTYDGKTYVWNENTGSFNLRGDLRTAANLNPDTGEVTISKS
jgi:hypothetical protein